MIRRATSSSESPPSDEYLLDIVSDGLGMPPREHSLLRTLQDRIALARPEALQRDIASYEPRISDAPSLREHPDAAAARLAEEEKLLAQNCSPARASNSRCHIAADSKRATARAASISLQQDRIAELTARHDLIDHSKSSFHINYETTSVFI